MANKSSKESDAIPAGASTNSVAGVTRTQVGKDPEFRMENTPYERRLPSCAECRRLKRRCDRKWPCQSCISRGCASICPNGSLSTEGSGSRSILRKIKEMSKRISQLEDALTAIWQGSEPHPLLKPELLKIKSLPDTSANNDLDENNKQAPKVKEEDGTDSLADELDNLTLGTNGIVSYLGRTAKIEVNLLFFLANVQS
jgi:Fungal Zn(2)-Cys(6) binuclear cluster domain